MKLENQVCSLELAKKLKELGVKQDSLFYWMFYTKKTTKEEVWELSGFGNWNITHAGDGKLSGISWKHDWDTRTSAFTVSELGEMLPRGSFSKLVEYERDHWYWQVSTPKGSFVNGFMTPMTEADARATMLIYLLENKLI